MKTCVIIPTYNESKAIGEVVATIKETGLDIIVVDDGSKDRTAKIAKKSGAFVIKNNNNKGKGASLKTGFSYALKNGYDAVIVMDGDGQHSPQDIEKFVRTAESTDADIIVGNRMHDPMSMPFVRRLTNRWMSGFISQICDQKIPDTQCGFRFIKREFLENVKLHSSNYEIESEMLIRAKRCDFKISSVPIQSIYNNERSAIHPIKDALRFIRLVIKIMLEREPTLK